MLRRLDQPEQDGATEALRAFIAKGDYPPGGRLPPERQLIDILGLGRGALRRALDTLEREGVIWRHVGKGTFVSHGSQAAAATDETFARLSHQMTPVRTMRARLCIEPAICREAAVNASREAMTRILTQMDLARSASTWADYERHDDAFHREVAEAADNALLLALFDQLNRVRREVARGAVTRASTRPPAQHSSFAEHADIARAIEAHDPEAAFLAMRRHLQSVAARLFGEP